MWNKFMSPQTGLRRYTYTHLKWFMGASVFSTFPLYDFSFFFPSLTQKTQKRKEADKLLFSTQMFFKRIFNFCSLICVLCFCLVAFFCFLCFWCFLVLLVFFRACWCFFCVQNLFVKKKLKKFKIAIITSFILLLKGAGLKSIKKTLQHRCLPVNTAKFLRTPFSTEHLRWLHLIKLWLFMFLCPTVFGFFPGKQATTWSC